MDTLRRLQQDGVVRDADLSNLVHDRNLKLLFECFEANELLLRLLSLLSLLELVALKPEEADLRTFFAAQLSRHNEMRTLLRLCAHGNEKLARSARALVMENRRCVDWACSARPTRRAVDVLRGC